MKILKIELQNINSLKSEHPIVIDFESASFRDVGLFVITGPTGAGKTTILDAITIAMYHEVPRFNKSFIKVGLVDVVSYGANDAMARVTFETKSIIYEAHWSIKLRAKNGTLYGNPKEEVRLKNMTTGEIIAEKSKELQSVIHRITQLNYDQFLRAVLLAQGEFAAFLSAPSKDKGILLEQITGGEIYKKIGEAVGDKIYLENKELDRIKSKINTEDLLTDEKQEDLKAEEAVIIKKIEKLDHDFKKVKLILDWFKKDEELINSLQILENERVDLEKEVETNEPLLNLLILHEKAEPCKPELDELIRIEKDIQKKVSRSLELNQELIVLNQNLDEVQILEKTHNNLFLENQNALNLWLPKLEQITQFDTEITNHQKNMATISKSITDLTGAIDILSENSQQKVQHIVENENVLNGVESFLQNNSRIPEIEIHFTNWNTRLTERKTNHGRLSDLSKTIQLSEKELNKINIDLEEKKRSFEQENTKLAKLNDEVESLSLLLASHNLEELLATHQLLENRKNQLRDLQLLTLKYREADQTKLILDNEKTEYENAEKLLNDLISRLQLQITDAEKSLLDANRILELEQAIKNFEVERSNLVEGEPCNLCGSKVHPYVQKYVTIELSTSQADVEKRKAILEGLIKDEKSNSIKLAEVSTKLQTSLSQLKTNQGIIDETIGKFNALTAEFKIEDLDEIQTLFFTNDNEIKTLSGKITETQQLLKQKEIKEKLLNAEQKTVTDLNNEIIRSNEKYLGLQNTLLQTKEEQNSLHIATESLENTLAVELKAFNLDLPLTESTADFIQQLEKAIGTFHAKNKELVELKNAISQLQSHIQNNDAQQKEKQTDKEKLQGEINELNHQLSKLSSERNAILPTDITTENKRKSLQTAVEKAKLDFDIITIKLNGLKTQQALGVKEKENLVTELEEYQLTHTEKSFAFNEKINSAGFDTRQDFENVLLTPDVKTKYITIRKQLEDKALTLKTLETKLKEEFNKQETEKNFASTKQEALEKHADLESSKDALNKRSGEINKQFELDNQIRQRNQGVMIEISAQEKVVKKWKDLMNLLGGSMNAFNTYVQRLTLQNLINLANIHLFKLNKRYSLKMNETYKPGEELTFMLVDHYQTDETRFVDTSSGGEKFLISLALALGLSDLASNNVSIGSLFIDEGFGTLDNATLETVISTLETLHAQGKMIGIISHVENLQERIPAQIQVRKKSNGVSEVCIV